MKSCLLLLLAFVCAHSAPTPQSSCKDATTAFIAGDVMDKINQDRTTGYVFSLERVSNVHQTRHAETGFVYYLTLDILETKCHVLSKKSYKECESRNIGENPVYGQCKAVIYVNRPQRVARLYKYSCSIRPVAASKIVQVCPDCPVLIPVDHKEVEKTMTMGLEKFNKESGLPNYFGLLNITRAVTQGGLITMYNVEFTIQETVCSNTSDIAAASHCGLMTCEFAHKGFCTATHTLSNGQEYFNYKCEIFEPQAAEEEKQRHLNVGEKDHHHENKAGASQSHDHTHDHTVSHEHSADQKHDHEHEGKQGHGHTKDRVHHHTHEHGEGHGKAHGHAHSHEHSHDHDHVHAHHDQAHNHTQDRGSHPAHHNYGHAKDETHEHDHELALDHQHKHGHLHEHEHHHHHHEHPHENTKRKPEGSVHVLPSLDRGMVLPSFPDQEEKHDIATGFPLHPDPEIPGKMEPVIGNFPKTVSSNCPAEFKTNDKLIQDAFTEDPEFKIKPAA